MTSCRLPVEIAKGTDAMTEDRLLSDPQGRPVQLGYSEVL